MKTIVIALALITTGCATNFDRGMQAYQHNQYRTALNHFIACSKEGDSSCMNNVGHIYLKYGHREEAIKWFNVSARYGNRDAIDNLSRLGELVPTPDLRSEENGDSPSAIELLGSALEGYNRGSRRNRDDIAICDFQVDRSGKSGTANCIK